MRTHKTHKWHHFQRMSQYILIKQNFYCITATSTFELNVLVDVIVYCLFFRASLWLGENRWPCLWNLLCWVSSSAWVNTHGLMALWIPAFSHSSVLIGYIAAAPCPGRKTAAPLFPNSVRSLFACVCHHFSCLMHSLGWGGTIYSLACLATLPPRTEENSKPRANNAAVVSCGYTTVHSFKLIINAGLLSSDGSDGILALHVTELKSYSNSLSTNLLYVVVGLSF